MSKVYFVGGHYLGCYYVRCFLPLLYNGWMGNYAGLEPDLKPIAQQLSEMRNSDIIVFHRADTIEHHKVAIELKRLGKKIVFDNDDTFNLDKTHAFYNLDDKGFKKNVKMKNLLINNFIKNCDLVTTSTEFLAEEYRKISKNVVVLPNCVNPEDWDEPLRNEDERVRVGIVGSTAYYHDFDIIKKEIRALYNDKRIKLVLFGLHSPKTRKENPLVSKVHLKEYGFWDDMPDIEHVSWCEMVDYFTILNELKLDMMLIPRRESYFNKAKSNVKFLEAAMCEIPVITNYFKGSPYEHDIDGTNGLMIKKDWIGAVETLMDKDVRRQMGANARAYVLANYNIKDKAHLWADAYETISN